MSAANSESRITRLEEGMFFQERLLRELNAALTGQQAQLDAMQRLLEDLREKVLEFNDANGEGGGPVAAKPPHYSA